MRYRCAHSGEKLAQSIVQNMIRVGVSPNTHGLKLLYTQPKCRQKVMF